MRDVKIRKMTFLALMTASAIVLSLLENLIPTAAFMPPGSKIGLSNIIVMFCASAMGFAPTIFVVIMKSVFVMLTRGLTAGLMSIAGGLLSALCLLLIFRKMKFIGSIGTGVISATMHNAGQLAVSFLMMRTAAVLGYFPVMLLASVATGILTGILFKVSEPYLNKIDNNLTRGIKK